MHGLCNGIIHVISLRSFSTFACQRLTAIACSYQSLTLSDPKLGKLNWKPALGNEPNDGSATPNPVPDWRGPRATSPSTHKQDLSILKLLSSLPTALLSRLHLQISNLALQVRNLGLPQLSGPFRTAVKPQPLDYQTDLQRLWVPEAVTYLTSISQGACSVVGAKYMEQQCIIHIIQQRFCALFLTPVVILVLLRGVPGTSKITDGETRETAELHACGCLATFLGHEANRRGEKDNHAEHHRSHGQFLLILQETQQCNVKLPTTETILRIAHGLQESLNDSATYSSWDRTGICSTSSSKTSLDFGIHRVLNIVLPRSLQRSAKERVFNDSLGAH